MKINYKTINTPLRNWDDGFLKKHKNILMKIRCNRPYPF